MSLFKKSPTKESHEADNALIDLISPAGLKIEANYIQIGSKYGRTVFVANYPQTLPTGWISPVITLAQETNVSIFVHPTDTGAVLRKLTKKSAQIQSQMSIQAEKGKVRDPLLDAALENVEELRDQLQQGAEKLFRFGLYITFLPIRLRIWTK